MLFIPIAITVSFNQSVYSASETDGTAQLVIILSNPSSVDITVEVFSTSITAWGEY